MKLKKLKGKLIEKDMTYKDVSKVLNISNTTVHSKLNGQTKFTCEEAETLSKALGLTASESIDIFFDSNLHNGQEN